MTANALPRVLIVDDEPRNLSLLEALLAAEKVAIERADGGRAAIDAFRRAKASGGFDLVLLDVMMPEVDGFTALAEMRRATTAGERVPIVLVTALGAREDRLRGLEAGADDFLTKPLDPNEVRCRVRTFLALHGAQRALRARAEELEQLQRAKAELSRMIVHDLKNPLSAVGSNLGWIERRMQKRGIDDGDLLEALSDARGSADRLLSLVSGLIDVEKAETGQLAIKKRATKMQELLEGVARRHRKAAEERSLTIDLEVDASLSADLDPDLLSRVLENLVENATRYTPAKGRIVLSARRDERGDEIAVSNDGDPIPEERRATVFDKHSSSEDRGARGRNLGLGLYFCKLAAEAHGGTIACESTTAWPTRFVVRLPDATVREAPTQIPPVLDARRPARAAFLD